jgi:hypothetical protein
LAFELLIKGNTYAVRTRETRSEKVHDRLRRLLRDDHSAFHVLRHIKLIKGTVFLTVPFLLPDFALERKHSLDSRMF